MIRISLRKAMMPKERTHPVDTHVGKRVRMRRLILGLSQTKLGDALDLTFQQVQKYEKGSNRIGASRLRHISQILQVPVEFFFKGAPQAQVHDHANNDAPSAEYVSEYLATSPPRMGCSSPKPSCRFQTRSFGDPSSILSSSSPVPTTSESFHPDCVFAHSTNSGHSRNTPVQHTKLSPSRSHPSSP